MGVTIVIEDIGSGIPIVNATVITTITDDVNWNGEGAYTGSVAGLVLGNYYYDDNMNLKYEFDGTTLRRISYNAVILI